MENPQRAQSNNSLIFWRKPLKDELREIFQQMIATGGSEPGFINGVEARRRAPWFKGVNPCAEILLGNKSFCNLVTVDLGKFLQQDDELQRAVYLTARANFRQTCVNLRDGVLSASWHELNEFLRLTGVGLAGVVKWLDNVDQDTAAGRLKSIKWTATNGVNSMADELGLPRSKAVTTIKPDGTFGKIADTTEGVHRPLGKYIFNNINFSKHDPLVPLLKEAGYYTYTNPYDLTGVIVSIPVCYDDVKFTEVVIGMEEVYMGYGNSDLLVHTVEVNTESAIDQLERYKLLMENYVDHNCSITVSYSPEEIDEIVKWLYENWDSYVGVSWLFRNDPTKTADDLGYAYLPQEVVTKEWFDKYTSRLKPVNLDAGNSHDTVEETCSSGSCPIR